jgi:hypothetical protein
MSDRRTTTDVALERLAGLGPSAGELAKAREVQRGIERAMVDVVRQAAYDPHAFDTSPQRKVTVVGAPVVKDLGAGPVVSEPWRPAHPTHDWLRLGSTVASANIASAEAQLAKLEKEEE